MALSALLNIVSAPSLQASKIIQDLTYTAQVAGAAGNSISLTYSNPGTPSASLSVSVVSSAITVHLATNTGTAASKVIQDLTYTAASVGVAGNSITITYVGDGTAGAETVGVVGSAITVHMDPTPVTGSTATQIKAAVDASSPAHALVSVAVSGTGSNVQTTQSSTALMGGLDIAPTSTASSIKSAVDASSPAHALVSVAVSGTGSNVQAAQSITSLANGFDTALTAPANQRVPLQLVISNSGGSPVIVDSIYPRVIGPLPDPSCAFSNPILPQPISISAGGTSYVNFDFIIFGSESGLYTINADVCSSLSGLLVEPSISAKITL